ncbi:MAG: hypothetical protein HYZ20_01820 [Burkholderiales bacterium]|nr:hypothetical protein [Burkholderiales bacterium]
MKNVFAIFGLVFFAAGCTHTQVIVKDPGDERLSCTEIATQTADIKGILRDIDDKTGFSGRNVAMGVFFWPGIIVNQMNAGDARKAANERLTVLAELAKRNNCS